MFSEMVLGLFLVLVLSLSPGMSCINLILPTMAQITGRSRSRGEEGVKELGLRSFAHTAFRYTIHFFLQKGKSPTWRK